jgi:hypothetical protein
MKERLYLDNCSFNRPYDDQSLLKNHLESEAKNYTQWQEHLFDDMSIEEISQKAAEYRKQNSH